MQENNIDEKLLDAILKVASEEAMRLDIEEMLSRSEANENFKPSPRIDKKIRKIISCHNFNKKFSSWKNFALKCTAGFAIFSIISSTILLSVEATRTFIFNAVIKFQENYFSIEHSDNSNEELIIYKPTYIPNGYNEISSNLTGNMNITIYQNENGAEILLRQVSVDGSNIFFDHEDKNFTIIKINQQDAYLVEADEKNKDNTITWEYDGFTFYIVAELETTELILTAESIKK